MVFACFGRKNNERLGNYDESGELHLNTFGVSLWLWENNLGKGQC